MAQRQSLHDEPVFVEPNETFLEGNKEQVYVNPKSSREEHERSNRVKHGVQRLDKKSAKRVSGLPKKHGQGGKYTWIGPIDEASLDEVPVALDDKDPNYMDEDDVVEVPKSDNSVLPAKVIAV